MPNLSITSQPPPWTAVSTILDPPLVARFRSRSRSSRSYFAMAILMGTDGVMVEGTLFGNTAVTGVEAGGRSGTDLSFHFTNLSIAYAGTYYIRVNVFKAPGHDCDATTFSAEVDSNHIDVTEG